MRGPATPRAGAQLRDLGIVEDGALLIRDGVIVEVGPERRVEQLLAARGAPVLDAAGGVIIPGLVDAHTHLLDSIVAGSRSFSAARIELALRERLRWFIRHGTTSLESRVRNRKEALAAAVVDGPLCDLVLTQQLAADTQTLPHVSAKHPFVSLTGLADPPDAVRLALLSEARARGLSTRLDGGSVDEAAAQSCLTYDHPEALSSEQLTFLAATAVLTVFVPGVHFNSRTAAQSARPFLDHGGMPALATGFEAGAVPLTSMLLAITLACQWLQFDVAEAISAATINAAHALGRATRIGSLEPGKQADLVILSLSDYRAIPSYIGVNFIEAVLKRGNILYRDGGPPLKD